MQQQISQLAEELTPILKTNDVVFAGLFGSQANGTAHKDSDYDFLIEFHPQKKYTLFNLVSLKQDLEKKLNKSVDVVTPNGLDKYIKQQVLDSVVSFYDHR
jgi:uncharacterized protein